MRMGRWLGDGPLTLFGERETGVRGTIADVILVGLNPIRRSLALCTDGSGMNRRGSK